MEALILFAQQLTKKQSITYTLRSKVIEPEEVFSATGLMPALVKRADQLCSLCFGVSSGATYADEKDAMLGTKLVLKSNQLPMGFYFCFADTLLEVTGSAKNTRVNMDELLYD